MKIEMGESLILSWLKHCKKCKIVQLNWKPSLHWVSYNNKKSQELFKKMAVHFPVFKNSNYEQIIKQAELDVVGINFDSNDLIFYVVDVAYHELGLNYGSKEETINRITKKMLRSVLLLYSYFNTTNGEVIFSSPKINPSIYEDLNSRFDEINNFMQDLNFNYRFKLLANSEFLKEILQPLKIISDSVDDTSELFMRAMQLSDLCNKFSKENNPITKRENSEVIAENDYTKIGELVRTKLNYLFKHNLISKEEISNLKDKEYCKKTFNINYPLLKEKSDDIKSTKDKNRYWSLVFDEKYYACNDWYENRGQKEKFEYWYNKLLCDKQEV